MTALAYWELWAKTSASDQWHALPYHLLDVAAAAESLWCRLPHQSTALPVRAFGGEPLAKRICTFLASAHDIGKANPYFQSKDRYHHGRLRGLNVPLPPYSPEDEPRHGQATGAHLRPWLMERWQWKNLAAETVARAVGGHHGSFFRGTGRAPLKVDCPPWSDTGRRLLDALCEVLKVPQPPEPQLLNPFLGWLSGFVSVADWLGSHESMTVWQTGEQSLAEYLGLARHRADHLLDQSHWQAPPSTPRLHLADLLPAHSTPKPLQTLAAEIAEDFSLAIVEAPTGEGKTEAAFALAEPTRSDGAGVYFALPTMATANGLHGRVDAYLQRATGNSDVQSRLLHSLAWLFRESASTAQNPGGEGRTQETHAQDWFAGSKRGLLAPYAVGTIDQALIAGLRAKHGFVRLFALAGKTVVIDEVHAYDVYMANILDVLLGWLRQLGCRVILLSATLPSARRAALLEAWGFVGSLPETRYPGITWITPCGEAHTRGFDVQGRKPLSFQVSPAGRAEGWEQGAFQILQEVRTRSGLGALVVNTVKDAQNAYDWLRGQDLGGIDLELFHARFTARDRDAIEARVLSRFGKSGARKKPAILVATQVVEQSLDLDCDHMVSMLAPIDLLIQRAGRLHRHHRAADGTLRDGPDQRPQPVLHVVLPSTGEDGLPEIKDPIYSPAVLMRTFRRLQMGLAIASPSDVADAVEIVYGEMDRPGTMSAWDQRLSEFEARAAEQSSRQQSQAEGAALNDVANQDHLIVETFLDLDENDDRQGSQLSARTRLEDRPSVTVALLREDSGRLLTLHGEDPANPRSATFSSVRMSPPFPLWEALLALKPLPAWAGRGFLSHTRPLKLFQGHATVAEYEVTYDSQRGLAWRRINAHVPAR